jgi:electron transfer flavoprotein beta subunit
MKNICVCVKQVLDPEMPLSLFKVDPEAKQAVPPKATPPVLSPFDENALEAALKIKDSQPAQVNVISLGKKIMRAVVKATLAAGADQLFILEDEAFSEFNTQCTSSALTAALKKIGNCDLILCGIQAADTNAGQVGIGIASLMGVPCITYASKVELIGDKVRVERNTAEGYETVEATTPVVVTVGYEVGALREPGVEAFMSANKKPMTVWNAQVLGSEAVKSSHTNFTKMYQPVQDVKCEMIEGPNPEEKAARLVNRLKEARLM